MALNISNNVDNFQESLLKRKLIIFINKISNKGGINNLFYFCLHTNNIKDLSLIF